MKIFEAPESNNYRLNYEGRDILVRLEKGEKLCFRNMRIIDVNGYWKSNTDSCFNDWTELSDNDK